ncbi:LysR family transcriptional regulator [Pseudomonas sp. JS3066]|jgi:DNA-binding transcriptional LysR family regulator|uniref:LysR family transcriptional regulator n=1 Tax=unclassified Pseudomonas TaxID=196821 RepID=UPI000EA96722|nr:MULTISPECIES: LysR family transcriptional regulator [unclassified Pseudomonas]AYF86395.1 LysR family transcriptional regulator [Pseudomonas sp. DY-1]MRK23728.1 LysR family transcriptional regulator [Pseudomonas sp. JG-B]WVK96154.1 LysR family transcriptional regulator [Pseudomonas sp. JS3066]
MRRLDINCFAEMSVFVRVVEDGGYTAAAKSCAMTPSAVSKLVSRLENRLGARLLNRSTRRQLLTSEGAAFYERSLTILTALDEAEQEAAASSAPQGTVRVNCNVDIGRLYLLPLLNEFLRDYPGVSVEVFLSDEVVDLISVRADVAIRSGPLKSSNLVARRLGDTRSLIVASPTYLAARGTPKVPADLEGHNCLGFTFSQPAMEWSLKGADGQLTPISVTGNARVSDGNGVRELAILGLGLARVGLCQVEQDLDDGRLVSVLEDFMPTDKIEVHAVYIGQGGQLPTRVRAFMDFLAANLKIS